MANPTELTDIQPATLLVNTTLQLLTIENQRSYTFAHDGETVAGVANTSKIYLFTAVSGHPTISYNDSEATQKAKLLAGRSITLGPGLKTIAYVISGNVLQSSTMLVAPEKLRSEY